MSAKLFFPLLACVMLLSDLRADQWPGWRGPSHDGLSKEQALPIRWGPNENVHWKISLPGIGHSSPIVWDDAIFVTTCVPEELSRRLLRIDRETGRILWNREIATSPIEEMHRDNNPAAATPVTDGQSIFVVFMVHDGLEVTALDFDGKKVWSRRVGSFQASHGFCSSLILDVNLLFLSGLQDGSDAFVAALDKRSGQIVWKVPRGNRIRSYSTPCLCTVENQPALLLSGADQTVAYHRQTGEPIWEIDGPGSKTVSSVVACSKSNIAFVCGGRDQKFFAIDLNSANQTEHPTSRIVWQATKGIPYITSPLLSAGKLHILSDEGVYRCYEAASGDLLKEKRAVAEVRSSMIANDRHIYVTDITGRTTVVNNDEHWTVLSENDIGEGVVASLAASNGDLVIRGDRHLFLIRDQGS